jgi:multisubunit Na+/H+ antiporter MnhG subunit
LISVKLGFVFFLLYVTSPTAAHALVKAAYARGLDAPDVEDATRTAVILSDAEGGR